MTKSESTVDDLLNILVPVVEPLVVAIEAQTPTTQNRYDRYMGAIAKLAPMAGAQPGTEVYKNTCVAIGVALQRAGANKAGVTSALRAMGCI